MDQVKELKAEADAVFKSKKWMEAAEKYGKTIEARKEATAAGAADSEAPQLFVLYNNRSAAYRNCRFAALAVEDAKTSLSIDSSKNNSRGWQRLGNAYRTLGKLNDAIKTYEKCMEIDPSDDATQDVIDECEQIRDFLEAHYQKDFAAIKKCTDVKKNEADPYGDGDQSEIPGLPQSDMPGGIGANLRQVWSQGADFSPSQDYRDHSDFMYHCFVGNVKEVEFLIDQVKDDGEALQQLVNKRESLLRLSPLNGAICGTRTQIPEECNRDGCLAVARILLLNGANPNAKDVAGYSIVHHVCTMYASPQTLELLPVLYARGADFNSYTRFGDGALCEPVMTGKIANVRALLQFGADPLKPDRKGRINLNTLAFGKDPILVKLLQGAHGWKCLDPGRTVALAPAKKVKHPTSKQVITAETAKIDSALPGKYRLAVSFPDEEVTYIEVPCEDVNGRNENGCSHCGKLGATFQCSVCKIPKYCDGACQKSHWKNGHKKECQQAQVWVIPAPKLDDVPRYQVDVMHGGREPIDAHAKLKAMAGKSVSDLVVKIQVPLTQPSMQALLAGDIPSATAAKPTGPIMVYDEGQKNLSWYVQPDKCKDYPEICEAIRKNGLQGGAKQYFRADLVKGDLHVVKRGLGPQPW